MQLWLPVSGEGCEGGEGMCLSSPGGPGEPGGGRGCGGHTVTEDNI